MCIYLKKISVDKMLTNSILAGLRSLLKQNTHCIHSKSAN